MLRYSEYSELEKYDAVPPPQVFCIEDADRGIQNVGWDLTKEDNAKYAFVFSQENMDYLSATISDALRGVDPQNRKIIIPDDKIANVLSTVYKYATRANIGDIHSRFIVGPTETRNDIKNINNQTINIIVSAIRDEVEMAEQNKTLSVWDQSLLGDFNRQGIRAHAPIKIRKRTPQRMAFNMNY
jgi:hypothetical protein